MRVGGPSDLIQAVKHAGGSPGPLVVWHGSWTMRNYAAIDNDVARAEAQGVPLLVQAWFGGDQLNRTFLTEPNGVWDPYQRIPKTRAQAMQFFKEVGTRTAKATKPPYIVIETEYNKGGIEKDPLLTQYLIDAIQAVKATNPKAITVLAPGDWQDLTVLAGSTNLKAFEAADAMGARTMRAYPRTPAGDLARAADGLLKAAQALRSAHPAKPVIVTDFAIGSYGGDVATVHPFGLKTDPKAAPLPSAYYGNEVAQKGALERVLALKDDFHRAGVDTFVYRGYRDVPNFDPQNYYGYAERSFGIARSDGAPKPAHAPLIALSKAPAPSPAAPSLEDYQAALQRAQAAEEALADEKQQAAILERTSLDLQERIRKAQEALAGR